MFRAHVGERPDELSHIRLHGDHGHVRIGQAGDSKIEGFRFTLRRHQDVAGLQIAVNNALLVGVLHGVANLGEQCETVMRVQILLPGVVG